MDWIIVALVGAIVGLIVAYGAVQALRMPSLLVIIVGTVGALGGGLIQRATGSLVFGPHTFYIAGLGLSIALVAGSLLAYSLANEERRV